MQLSNAHRKWIQSNKDDDMPCLMDYQDDKIILHSTDATDKWLDKFINLLKSQDSYNKDYVAENLENNIILTWTNKKCNKYNDWALGYNGVGCSGRNSIWKQKSWTLLVANLNLSGSNSHRSFWSK